MHREKANPHLEKLRENLLNSDYPNHIIEKHMARTIYEIKHNIKTPEKPPYQYIYRIPYFNESFTNKIKSIIKKSNINARVVVVSGTPVLSLMKTVQVPNCQCISCSIGIPCTNKNFVYKAECRKGEESYIRCSGRPAGKRINEHEASIRNKNDATTLGQHYTLVHPGEYTLHKHRPTIEEKAQAFKEAYNFEIIHKGRDNLDAYLMEGIAIIDNKAGLNNNFGNGFIK